MPVFATGKVAWIRERDRDLAYNFDAGIKLKEIDSLKMQKLSEYDFGNWHMKRIAEYAFLRGYFAKKFPDRSVKIASILPSLLFVYLVIGGIYCFVYLDFVLIYAATFIVYFSLIFLTTLIRLLGERGSKILSERMKLLFPVSAAIISSQLTAGLFFISRVIIHSDTESIYIIIKF